MPPYTLNFPPQTPAGETTVDILLIDDDESVLKMLTGAIRRCGYSWQCATDGKEAMALLAKHHFRLVITDIYMPNMDGLEIIMKFGPNNPDTPILAISGGCKQSGPASILKVAKHLGCGRTLEKPFELPVFLSLVNELIGEHAAQV